MMRLLTRALLWSLAALLVAGAAAGQKITGVTGPGGSLSNPVTPAQGGTGGDFSASTGVLYDAAGTFSAIACASGLLQGGTPPTCTNAPSISGQLTSTLATGTAPFVIASTTNVANLNASSLGGATFAAPGPIGGGTPSTGAFSSLAMTGNIAMPNGSFVLLSGGGAIQFNNEGTPGQLLFNSATSSRTSGGLSAFRMLSNFTPPSGSSSYAALSVLPTINGTSTGTAYGLLVSSITNTLTGGTIKLASFGFTTTDGFTGYTREFEVLTLGAWFAKTMTASAAAPGADGAKFEVVCGTNAGSVKLVMYGGTSGTAVTIVDNVGSGATGC